MAVSAHMVDSQIVQEVSDGSQAPLLPVKSASVFDLDHQEASDIVVDPDAPPPTFTKYDLELGTMADMAVPRNEESGPPSFFTTKRVVLGVMDMALLTANASQLRSLLEATYHPFRCGTATMLIVSIALQLLATVIFLLVYWWESKVHERVCEPASRHLTVLDRIFEFLGFVGMLCTFAILTRLCMFVSVVIETSSERMTPYGSVGFTTLKHKPRRYRTVEAKRQINSARDSDPEYGDMDKLEKAKSSVSELGKSLKDNIKVAKRKASQGFGNTSGDPLPKYRNDEAANAVISRIPSSPSAPSVVNLRDGDLASQMTLRASPASTSDVPTLSSHLNVYYEDKTKNTGLKEVKSFLEHAERATALDGISLAPLTKVLQSGITKETDEPWVWRELFASLQTGAAGSPSLPSAADDKKPLFNFHRMESAKRPSENATPSIRMVGNGDVRR